MTDFTDAEFSAALSILDPSLRDGQEEALWVSLRAMGQVKPDGPVDFHIRSGLASSDADLSTPDEGKRDPPADGWPALTLATR